MKKSLIGKVFGRLTVKEPAPSVKGVSKWLCDCLCGNTRVVSGGSLASGRQMSCGCLRIERLRNTLFLPNGEGAVGDLYRSYLFKAKSRNLPFLLTRDEFREIIFKNCIYCGIVPSRIKRTKSGSTVQYNGVDRANNKQGYSKENAVPCCTECNFAKGEMHADAFLKWLDRVSMFRNTIKVV